MGSTHGFDTHYFDLVREAEGFGLPWVCKIARPTSRRMEGLL